MSDNCHKREPEDRKGYALTSAYSISGCNVRIEARSINITSITNRNVHFERSIHTYLGLGPKHRYVYGVFKISKYQCSDISWFKHWKNNMIFYIQISRTIYVYTYILNNVLKQYGSLRWRVIYAMYILLCKQLYLSLMESARLHFHLSVECVDIIHCKVYCKVFTAD